jgi:ferric-dicitrate binding protein FerR (iron transport regulator)
MSIKENKNLHSWKDSTSEVPPKDIESLWNMSGQYNPAYSPDVEKGLSRLKNRMSQSTQPAPVVNIGSSRRQWMRIAAAIALILSVAFVWKFAFQNQFQSTATASNEQQEVLLEDGTVVFLNQNSMLEYPETFDGSTREVKLTGEAYFDVAHNPAQPFIIKTSTSEVKVLGTSFNLRAYPKEIFTEVEVESGKVEFKVKSRKGQIQLVANEKGVYNHGVKLEKRGAENLNAQAWRTGQLRFKALPLLDAIDLIKRKYNVKIDIAKAIEKCAFTSNFDQQSDIESVFEAMKLVLPVQITKKQTGTYQISGETCK